MSRSNGSISSRPGSLTNVVQSLVRAQYGLTVRESSTGASTPGSSNGAAIGETETDLDRHVAELLMKEAKEREERSKRENVGYWRLSDDEGEQQYQSKTNKRFLTNMIRNVEDHNKPLIRQQSRKEDLDTIRARERAEREKRTGIRDAERSHRRGDHTEDATETSASTSRSRRDGRGGPGFAARSLAIGLSGAMDARKQEDKKRKDIEEAVAKAKETVEGSRKGKERARLRDSEDEDEEDSYHRGQQASRPEEGRSKRSHGDDSAERERRDRTSSRRDDRDRTHRRRDRSRSRSDDDRRDRRERDDRPSTSSRHRSSRRRSQSDEDRNTAESPRESKSSKLREREETRKRRRTRSPTRSTRSPSDSESDSSDTFVDTTGLPVQPNGESGPSKMDKYFSASYNPALDVSFTDLTDPSTGLIGEGNFSEWDKMLHVLKKRKEDKSFGVTQAREEERDRQLRKLEKKKRKEEKEERRLLRKEKKHKKKRKRAVSDSESGSSDSVGPKMRSEKAKTVVIDGYEYGKKGSVRAWDLGKE